MLIEAPKRIKPFVPPTPSRDRLPFPTEVEMILSAMEAGQNAVKHDSHDGIDAIWEERRANRRLRYRARAELRLFRDQAGSPAWLLYVRDADTRGLGFVTSHRLPLGYGGYVELIAPTGRPMSVHCTLSRCREAVPGWYEGALSFNREQNDFLME